MILFIFLFKFEARVLFVGCSTDRISEADTSFDREYMS